MAQSASPVRAECLRLVQDAQRMNFGQPPMLKQGPVVALAILDLADAVRELARSR
jgi:hypothetical protein